MNDYNIKADLLKEVLKSISSIAVKVSWLLMKMPEEWHRVDCIPPWAQDPKRFYQRTFWFLKVLKNRGTKDRIKGI